VSHGAFEKLSFMSSLRFLYQFRKIEENCLLKWLLAWPSVPQISLVDLSDCLHLTSLNFITGSPDLFWEMGVSSHHSVFRYRVCRVDLREKVAFWSALHWLYLVNMKHVCSQVEKTFVNFSHWKYTCLRKCHFWTFRLLIWDLKPYLILVKRIPVANGKWGTNKPCIKILVLNPQNCTFRN
jgi:hypothetical protein